MLPSIHALLATVVCWTFIASGCKPGLAQEAVAPPNSKEVLPARWEPNYCGDHCLHDVRELPVTPAARDLARRASAALLADIMRPLSDGSSATICGRHFAKVATEHDLFVATEPRVPTPRGFRVRSVANSRQLSSLARTRGGEIPYFILKLDSNFLLRDKHGVAFRCQWGFWHHLKRGYHPTVRSGLIFEVEPNRFVVIGRISGFGTTRLRGLVGQAKAPRLREKP